MSDLRQVNFRWKSEKKLTQQIEKELCYEVEEMIRYGARSSILKTSLLSNLRRVNIREKSEKKLIQQIEKELCYKVEEISGMVLALVFSRPPSSRTCGGSASGRRARRS